MFCKDDFKKKWIIIYISQRYDEDIFKLSEILKDSAIERESFWVQIKKGYWGKVLRKCEVEKI